MPICDIGQFWQRLRIVAIWVFLTPLIVILGTVDVLTNGRSRSWLSGDRPRNDKRD
ncbi:MAG: hypothetical protein JWR39_737 [Devosia sp.]|jgi:hypothetical protein|nr:hypothetical protein [Devosia sp.]